MNSYPNYITKLGPKEVFQMGTNLSGFHGSGSAGYASFNRSGNVWREEKYGEKPLGWRGLWNVKGVSEGFQKGTIGMSYGIVTVTKAGVKRSIPLERIEQSILSFYAFALSTPQLTFYVAQDAKMGLNGYTSEEMARAYSVTLPPKNVLFYEPFAKIIYGK